MIRSGEKRRLPALSLHIRVVFHADRHGLGKSREQCQSAASCEALQG